MNSIRFEFICLILCLALCTFTTAVVAGRHAHHTRSVSSFPQVLQNDHLTLQWSGNSQLISMIEGTSETNFIGEPNATDSWWSVHAVTPNSIKNQPFVIDLFTPSLTQQPAKSIHQLHKLQPRTGDQTVTFSYDNLVVDSSLNATLSITITVLLPNNASHVEFSIAIEVGSVSGTPEIGVEWVSWKLPNVNPEAGASFMKKMNPTMAPNALPADFLIWPTGYGVKTITPSTVLSQGTKSVYPSTDATYQLIMYYFNSSDPTTGIANGPGLMTGALDGQGFVKTFLFQPRADGSDAFDLEIHFIPPNAGQPIGSQPLTFGYPAFVGVFTGDWYDGSRMYKNFVMRSSLWTTGGVLRDRSDLPAWLLNTNVWINSGWQGHDVFNATQGDPDVVTERVTQMVQLFNSTSTATSPLGLHWYEWDNFKFDTNYPDYFPVKPGFQAAVNTLQNMNVKIAPYINGRIFDVNTPTWTNDEAINYACKQTSFGLNETDYALYQESYGSGSTFAVMCPATSYWAGKLANITGELIQTYGVSAVYIDQIGAATPELCSDPTHGHTLVGGNYWAEGYYEVLSKVRQSFGESPSQPAFNGILTESNAEVYMHKLNVYLAIVAFDINPSGDLLSMAPVFPALYGGFYLSAGAMFYQTDLTWGPDVFAAKLAMQFLEGEQLGWFSLGGTQDPIPMGLYELFTSGDYDPEIDLVNRLGVMRGIGKQHLTFGRRTRDVVLTYGPSDSDEIYTHPHQPMLRRRAYQHPKPVHSHHDHDHDHNHHSSISSRSGSSPSTHTFSSALHSFSPAYTYSALAVSTWLSEIGCTTDRISMGLFLVSTESAGSDLTINFKIDLRNYDLTDAAGENWNVIQMNLDGTQTILGTYEGTQVEVVNLVIQPRQVIYLMIQEAI